MHCSPMCPSTYLLEKPTNTGAVVIVMALLIMANYRLIFWLGHLISVPKRKIANRQPLSFLVTGYWNSSRSWLLGYFFSVLKWGGLAFKKNHPAQPTVANALVSHQWWQRFGRSSASLSGGHLIAIFPSGQFEPGSFLLCCLKFRFYESLILINSQAIIKIAALASFILFLQSDSQHDQVDPRRPHPPSAQPRPPPSPTSLTSTLPPFQVTKI